MRARIEGAGPAAQAAARALVALGLPLTDGPCDLLVLVAPAAALTALDRLAARAPAPAPDAGGEIRAAAQAVLILGRAAPETEAAMRAAALRLAPRLRINAVACDLRAPGDLAPVLGWLTGAHAVTGQCVRLGPARRRDAWTPG